MQLLFKKICQDLEIFASANSEAKIILEDVTTHKFNDLILKNYQCSKEELTKINSIIERRLKHEPLQYILGVAPFYNFELKVNSNVLIPRFETEIMVEYILDNLEHNGKLLDIGCGSGTISVTCAYERKDIKVTAIDISQQALQIAKLNAEHYHLKNISFLHSDLFSNINADDKFDFISANLPYIPYNEYLECDAEVKDYEPFLALVADDEGFELIEKCANKALDFLAPNGTIIFEIGHNQATRLTNTLEKLNYKKIKTLKDYNNFERFVIASID